MESTRNGNAPKPGVSGESRHGRPGGDRENPDRGDISKTTTMVAVVPGLPLNGADGGTSCGGSGEGIASSEGATATREGESCPQKQKQEDGDGGRLRRVEMGGVATQPADAATAVDGDKNSGDSIEVGTINSGIEDQHKRDCGIVCQEQGVDGRVGAESARRNVGAEEARPPAAWTSSKRPRKEEADVAAVA